MDLEIENGFRRFPYPIKKSSCFTDPAKSCARHVSGIKKWKKILMFPYKKLRKKVADL